MTVTAEQIALALKQANPSMRFAHHNDCCVGVWNKELRRFQWIYAKAITGEWVDLTKEGETLVNGKPAVAANEWIEADSGARREPLPQAR